MPEIRGDYFFWQCQVRAFALATSFISCPKITLFDGTAKQSRGQRLRFY